ncbi:MAG: dihydrodipicolinate synthase family protein [Acidobacteria bacterium]|nr:dihydrodipicolinate synthase family protein [Acidobacteriota bacterium]
MNRRHFLFACAAAALRAEAKPLKGIFPIVQTPYTGSNHLDTETLGIEIQFLDRCGVHGVVWPQLASEWSELTPDERMDGAAAVMDAAKGRRVAVVLGVQGPDQEAAVRYARHAAKLGPDAIIALPPRDAANLDRVAGYYRAIGKACGRPLFVQTIGNMPIDFVRRLARDISTLRFVKDEAGHTLSRISEYSRVAPELGVFTGAHGRTLLDELERGASGTMPASAFGDLYVKVWDLWQAGKREAAMEVFSRVALLVHQMQAYGLPALKYILHLRGVFPNWRCRGKGEDHFDSAAERSVRETYEFARLKS